jgi:hypothetical protein
LELYEVDFVPEATLEKPQIRPEESPYYHIYQRIQQEDFEDFYEVEDEEEQGVQDIPEESEEYQDHGGPVNISMATQLQQRLGASNASINKSSRSLAGSYNNLATGASPRVRDRGVDETAITPSQVREKFKEVVKNSPMVPSPGRKVPIGSPKSSNTPSSPGRRNIVSQSSQVVAPVGSVRVEVKEAKANVIQGTAVKAKTELNKQPAATKAEDNNKKPEVKAPVSESLESESIFDRMKREVQQKKAEEASGATKKPAQASASAVASAAKPNLDTSAEWLERLRQQRAREKEDSSKKEAAQKVREQNMPDWMKQLKKEKEAKSAGMQK